MKYSFNIKEIRKERSPQKAHSGTRRGLHDAGRRIERLLQETKRARQEWRWRRRWYEKQAGRRWYRRYHLRRDQEAAGRSEQCHCDGETQYQVGRCRGLGECQGIFKRGKYIYTHTIHTYARKKYRMYA